MSSNMAGLSRFVNFVTDFRVYIFICVIGMLLVLLSMYWPFWLILGIIVYAAAVFYFSRGLKDIFNIHVVTLSLIILTAAPSTVMILQGEIVTERYESLAIFSSISLGLIGYIVGALITRNLFSFEKRKNTRLSRQFNLFFNTVYKNRYALVVICCIVLFFWGFRPMSMSYAESVTYRFETLGIVQYFNSIIPTVFSPLILAMVVIIGDLKRINRLSWLSYFLIILVIACIIGGYRFWIIALFACMMIAFQPYLKRTNMVLIVILAVLAFFVISAGVRYARSGGSFTDNINNFSVYLTHIGSGSFTEVMWGSTDFTIPFSTFLTVVNKVPQYINFDYTLPLKDLSLVIPTVFYPDRPLPPAAWYVQTFEPEIYQRGGGLTFYVVGTGYLFAGTIGVFLLLFTYGVLLEWLGKFFKLVGNAAGLFLYSYFFIQLFSVARGNGPAVFVKVSITDVFIPIALLLLFVLILNTLRLRRTEVS